jgi:single-strand DNA-binding protein
MANLNKVMLIGRLTRDPEVRTFANGGKVAKFGFAVNFKPAKRNPTTGEWEKEPVYVDVEVFNQERRQMADLVEQSLRKGNQVYIEGRLRLNEWTDKEGQKRSKLLVVVDTFEFLEPRGDGSQGDGGSRFQRGAASSPRSAMAPTPTGSGYDEPAPQGGTGGGQEEDIPF